MRKHLAALLSLVLGAASPAWAKGLMDNYRLALERDPVYQQAVAGNQAVQEQRPQARSRLLPTVGLNANTLWNEQSAKFSRDSEYNTHQYSLSLTQPVFNYESWVQLRQADARIKQASAELDFARQDLMLRLATRYFEVLGAEDTLEFVKKTKEAIGQQLNQAQQRFEVGLIAVTDVEEAKAAYDQAAAAEIEADNALANAYAALREVIGEDDQELKSLSEKLPLSPPEPNDIREWTQTSLDQNLNLAASIYAQEFAREEIKRNQAGHYPTVDVVAGRDYQSSGGRVFSGIPLGSSKTTVDSIGVVVNVPIYQGGFVSSRVREAQHLSQQASDRVEEVRRATERQAHDAFLGVTADIARVQALGQVVKSTQTALAAIEAGFEVGTRTSVDVVNAQRNLYQSRRDHQAARYAYVLDGLRLKQAAGTLSDEDIAAIDRWLQ